MLLTGPFGGLTDDVRELLACLADEGLPLTGWGDLDPASLRTVRERLPAGGAGGDGPDGLALARRRTALLRSLCDAGRLTEAESGVLQLTALGRSSSTGQTPPSSASCSPPGGRAWTGATGTRPCGRPPWPPGAMLGVIDIPARLSPSPAWFALTGTTPALLAAAAAMSGPEPPVALAAATQN